MHPVPERVRDTHRRALDLFLELVQIPSPPGAERGVADRIIEIATTAGLSVSEDAAARHLQGSTGNLVIDLEPQTTGTPLVFCAHMDTVPSGAIQPVVSDDGIIRSRGETILGADNKAAVAAMLVAAEQLTNGACRHAGVEFLFTPMEEVGCCGAKAFDARSLRARTGFVYDHAGGIGTYVASAPSGLIVRAEFLGRPAHAGLAPEEGRSAIRAAAHAVARLDHGRLADQSTVNVGLISGGTAHNVVAQRCSVTIDVRARTDEAAEVHCKAIILHLQSAADASDCRVDIAIEKKYEAYRLREEDSVVRIALVALRDIGATPKSIEGWGGADSSVLNEQGVACLNLGCGMDRVHTAEESIAVRDLGRLVDLTVALARAAAS